MRNLGRPFVIGGSLVIAVLLSAAPPLFAQTVPATVAPAAEASVPAPPPEVSSTPPVSHLFKDTISDFRRLPSRDTLTWLSVGVAAALVAHTEDAAVSNHLSGFRRLDGAFAPGRTIGGARLELGGALATYTLGRLTGSPRVTNVGADLIQAQILTEAMTGAAKYSVRRTRPDGSGLSFPSGHASVTFASATVLQRHFGWTVGVPAYGVAAYVAASRIQMNRHYLSDVAFGAALGIIAGRTVTIGHGNTRFALTPLATSGGGGVAFTLIAKQ